MIPSALKGGVPALDGAARFVVVAFVVASFSAFLLLVCAHVATISSPAFAMHPIVDDTKSFSTNILLAATPVTNAIIATSGKDRASGGVAFGQLTTFGAYQVAGWICYGTVVWLLSTCDDSSNTPSICRTHETSVAYAGFLAQLFTVSSLLALEKLQLVHSAHADVPMGILTKRSITKSQLFLHNYMNLLAVVGALFLALSAEYVGDRAPAFSTNASLGSLSLGVAAIMSTYGLGGILSNDASQWKFWQPFSGGVVFVAVQIISWTCFTFSVLLQGCFFLSLVFVVEVELFVGIMGLAGALSIASQIGMMVSLVVYVPPNTTRRLQLEAFVMRHIELLIPILMTNLPAVAFMPWVLPWLLVPSFSWHDVAIYTVVHIGVQTLHSVLNAHLLQVFFKHSSAGKRSPPLYWAVPLVGMTLPAISACAHVAAGDRAALASVAFATAWYAYTIPTMVGMPAQTGCREDKRFRTQQTWFMETAARYFSLNLVRTATLDPAETYIFGFHPHGIIPMTVMWLQFTDQWRALFPGIFAHPLSASVVHYFPGIRDVVHLLGGREVTRTTFSNTLKAGQSIFVVPGGQAELVESVSRRRQVRVYTGHKGFVRMALEHGTPLVPVLSFKEGEILDNVRFPVMQKWFIKRFALPCPYYPHGWTWLPIPNRVGLTIAVGDPLPVTKVNAPTHAQVDALHEIYFGKLKEMFHAHKEAAGCADYELVFIDK
ncbi:Aste57867_20676 [Aphanomyces stellatus]|uniref:Aste57867_20676 protein n=1 Tax=Aphanomyces stellatus TaxID=120398 RepID=A0A485LG84_9STRA|nr:hypothetical protein As57867_020608 [Aphanomyces stellatus]VFT97356.1 Aste57867_20676 [Aphanomyces stellatus]